MCSGIDPSGEQHQRLSRIESAFSTAYTIQEHSRSLLVFVFLIAVVSIISVIGNLCLAKVLYSKRCRLVQTDRIVLCLALSEQSDGEEDSTRSHLCLGELCLVLIDTPTEIYRFLSYSFTLDWLCRFHTFFEALFSACIIFYHLLGRRISLSPEEIGVRDELTFSLNDSREKIDEHASLLPSSGKKIKISANEMRRRRKITFVR